MQEATPSREARKETDPATREDPREDPREAAPDGRSRARQAGVLVKWNDERGFGFIQPEDGSGDLFVHVSGLRHGTRRPREGDKVRYEIDCSQSRPKAVEVRVKALPLPNTRPLAYGLGAASLAIFFLHAFGVLRLWAPMLAYLVMSIVTFGFFYVDKTRAEKDRWRLTETSLHVLECLGGWPGSVVAIAMLRHKTRQVGYLLMLCAIVAIHVATWLVLLAGHAGHAHESEGNLGSGSRVAGSVAR